VHPVDDHQSGVDQLAEAGVARVIDNSPSPLPGFRQAARGSAPLADTR
jgi:hypothetical protein